MIRQLGGCEWGGYVNSDNQDNPTIEVSREMLWDAEECWSRNFSSPPPGAPTQFFPSKGEPITMNLLKNTMPVNLFPLTWLLPSGEHFALLIRSLTT